MFIAMSAVSVVSFDLAFLFERYLRHTGILAPNTSHWQKIYSGCATIAAIAGAAGLILLTIFDTKRHSRLHVIFLCVFIGGYIISAIFICWEYQRLGIHYRQHSILRISFWVKLAFILLEIAMVIAFGVCSKQHKYNVAAVLEWTISFTYCFYVLSFFMDFLPVVIGKDKNQDIRTEMQMAEEGAGMRTMGDGAADSGQYFRGNAAPVSGYNGYSNGTATNGATHGHSNGYNGNGYVSHDAHGCKFDPYTKSF
jgi:hypothetical protein